MTTVQDEILNLKVKLDYKEEKVFEYEKRIASTKEIVRVRVSS